MKQVSTNLYVGTVEDFQEILDNSLSDAHWSILGACKDPLHRKYAKLQGAACAGYSGRAMPKDEPEYLFAKRNHALYCNLIDANDMKYIPDAIIEECLEFISKELAQDRKVLIVCNKGESRSPSIALMYMIEIGEFDDCKDWDMVLEWFREVYPAYNPKKGFYDYVKQFYENNI